MCNARKDVCIQATVQERIHGLTLHEAIESNAGRWSIDDWKSLVIQVTCSLVQLQTSLGYVQWDSHTGNLMVCEMDERRRLTYVLDDTHALTTPASNIVVKWMDTSSAMLARSMDQVEFRRACA